ncbi:glycosyltransferase [Luteolibacter soli]|uniref:Glycosyltransferase n=1 Tax=Luteolibacter soli TaxID=3135280 RepID=A0ABU9ATK2_9BACT
MNPVLTTPRVAVVFACYNRRDTALECVKRLRAQSRQPDRVIVADNASTDGSAAALNGLCWDALEILDIGDNLGNAGGVQAAMEHAFAHGMDAVWILDDDSWPRPDALEEMLRSPWRDDALIHPLQEDPATGRFTWPLQVVAEDGSVSLAHTRDELPDRPLVRSRGVWTGAMIPKKVREAAGPVKGELFIRGEDEEYPWRIEKAGFPTYAVTAAVMDHPGPKDLVQWRFLGRSLFLERGLADWKLHYKVRNMVWLKRQQAGATGALTMALAYALCVASVDGPARLPLVWRAFLDGWQGKLGRLAG